MNHPNQTADMEPTQRPIRILHLEDNHRDAEMIQDKLAADGLASEIVQVADKKQFEAALLGDLFDVVLCDYDLPDYDGISALRLAREKQPTTPVILVSGALGEEVAVKCLQMGAADYLLKQRLERLASAIKRAINEAKEHRKRQQAEEKMRESEARFRDLFENANDLIQSVRLDGSFLYVNRAWRETLGYSEAEVPGLSLRNVIHPSSLDHCMELFQSVLRGAMLKHVEAVFVAKDKREIVVEGNSSCHFVDGKPVSTRSIFRDITERKRAQLNLARSHKQFHDLFEFAPDAILMVRSDGIITMINRQAEALFGYTRAELTGQPVEMLVPEVLRGGHVEMRHQYLAHPAPRTMGEGQSSLRAIRKNGTTFSVEISLSPIESDEGIVVAAAVRDITERRRTQETLKLFRTLIDRSSDTIEIVDPETGRFLDVNEKGCLELGCTREEYLAQSIFDIDRTIGETSFARSVEELRKSGVLMSEGMRRRKDGSTFPVEVNLRYARLERDYIVTVVRDITERRRVEAALRESERIRRLVLDSVDEIIYMVESDMDNMLSGKVRFVGGRVEKILGYQPEEFLRDPDLWFSIIHPDDAPMLPESTRAIFASGQPGLREYRVRHKRTANYHWMEDHVVPQLDAVGRVVSQFGTARDVTERKRIDAQSLRTQRLESIGTLASGVAHDLNNALAPILMATELLRLEFPDRASSLLELIQSGARRGADLVKQLLTFAKGAEGERLLVQPRHLLKEIANLIASTFPKNIQLRTSYAKDLRTILGDTTQLHQVLLNLCVNARDAMPNGGTLTLEAENAEIDAVDARAYPEAKPGHYVVMRVRDTGTGIRPEIMDRIFEPFFSTKALDKGTGLGLSTVIGIVKSHGGFMRVYSAPGQGSAFTAYLPACLSDTDGASLPAEPESTFRGNGETVLVVDDEYGVRDILRTSLTKLNFKVLTASDGTAAMVQVAEKQAELRAVITDLHMPHMDGLSFVRVLKARLPQGGIIVMSGRLDEQALNEFKALGVSALLDKPFSQEKLVEALKTVFQK